MKAKTKKAKKQIKSALKIAKHHIKMAVIPHKKNDYRPHLIRRYGLMAVVFIVIGLQLGYNGATTGNVLGRESDITVTSLLDQTNQVRVQNGELPLVINEKLNKAAYLKAQDMFDKQYWAHDAPDGTKPWKWFGVVDYNYNEAGENLAKNFSSTPAVMTAWINSSEHKENILNKEYRDVGFAVVDGTMNSEPTSLVVAFYGTPVDVNTIVTNTEVSTLGASPGDQVNVFTQFAVAYQSLTPAVIGSLVIITLTMIVATTAHFYRKKLPKSLRQSWYRHHGLYKVTGLILFGVIIVFMYGGGQI